MGGPILLSLVLALALVPSAPAYQVANTLNETAHVYSMGVGEIRCPSREEWEADWASSFGWAYTDVRKDYTQLGPVVCTGALGVGGTDVPAWQQALGVLVLTHEAFHLRHWRYRKDEGKSNARRWRTSETPRADWGRRPHRPRTSTPTRWRCTTTKSSSSPSTETPSA